ncbi:hypothetical protein C5S35_00860 [Candidatus Methanophagaceae archaeon]|nr:hypothetical protein C5S35_00860 [Methanophagales archaeon]
MITIGKFADNDQISQYNLVEGNVLTSDAYNCHAGIGVRGLQTRYNIIRNNTVYNLRRFLGCANIYWNLIEHNMAYNHGHNHFSEEAGTRRANTIQALGYYNIFRFNMFFEHENTGRNSKGVDGIQTHSGTYNDIPRGVQYHKIYHNIIWRHSAQGIAIFHWNNEEKLDDNVYKNNIICHNGNVPELEFVYQVYYNFPNGTTPWLPTDIWDGNLIMKENNGQVVISFGNRGDFTLDAAKTMFPDIFLSKNIEGDPQFTDVDSHDFRLQANSPGIDAGVFLTHTMGSGSGTSFQVDDAGYFVDGCGLIEGDLIQLEGQTQAARVAAVDYANDIITLDRNITWNTGDGVSLAYTGSAPDIGAFEYQSAAVLAGDLNHDGKVNIQDVQLCVNVILGTETNSEIVAKADVNDDGEINVLDLQAIVSICCGSKFA